MKTDQPSGHTPSKGTLAGLCALAFLVLCSYELARSSVESLFLEVHSSGDLPLVWLLVGAAAFGVVALYNRVSSSWPLVRVLAISAGASIAALGVLHWARLAEVPGAYYALYVWKDIYIVVLVEIFWTIANSLFSVKKARWYYGIFLVMGTLGALTGGLGVGVLAEHFGTAATTWFVAPILLVVIGVALLLGRSDDLARLKRESDEPTSISEGVRVIKESRYLLLMIGLIAAVQLAITLVDYEYNVLLEAAYPDTDARTAVSGQVYSVINVASLVLQLLTGPILALAGVSRVLLGIPLVLATAVGLFLAGPRFLTIAVAKVASKCFDYSLFRAAKEILYIPLSYREKTQGKAVVDMLTYRLAKGSASAMLLGLLAIEWADLAIWLTFAAVVGWIVVTVRLLRRFRERSADQDADSV